MKVSCLQDRLAKGLSIVSRAVTSKVLPVLSNILIAADDARLKLAATNLEIGITCWIGGKVEEEGATTVPARLLAEFVNSLPRDAKIDMSLDVRTQTLNLRCAGHDARIKGIDASEFPVIPAGDGAQPLPIHAETFRHTLAQVLFAAASDETRPILTGVLTELRGTTLTLAAADGFRLAMREYTLRQPVPEPVSIIVPARAYSELSRVISQVEMEEDADIDIIIAPLQNQVLFQLHNADPNVDFVSQLIEGNFPDVRAIIPTTCNTRVIVDTQAFLEALRVAYLFARDSANIVRLNITPGTGATAGGLQLTASSPERGDDVSSLEAVVEGDPIEIAFNVRYLIDAVSAVEEPEVILETTSPSRPGVIRPNGNPQYVCVIMPMHLGR